MSTPIQRRWKSFLSEDSSLFVIKILLVYGGWKVVHYFLLHTHGPLHLLWEKWIYYLGSFYACITSFVLNIFNEGTIYRGHTVIYLRSLRHMRVEEHCLAIPATIIFVGSIALFKGSWRNKLWFIPLGVFGIILINATRLVFLCTAFEHFSAEYYRINHSFVYVVITYTLILLMIIWWMKRFAHDSNVPSKT